MVAGKATKLVRIYLLWAKNQVEKLNLQKESTNFKWLWDLYQEDANPSMVNFTNRHYEKVTPIDRHYLNVLNKVENYKVSNIEWDNMRYFLLLTTE